MAAHAVSGDLIVLGDVDEIPRPEMLRALRTCPFEQRHNCANLDGSYFYYSYSGYAGDWKAGPKVIIPSVPVMSVSSTQSPASR